MGRTFRASSHVPTRREPLKEEKEKTKVSRSSRDRDRDRPEKEFRREEPKRSEKNALQETCLDLKKEAAVRRQEQIQQANKAKADLEFEQLMAQMYGPQIDSRVPLLQFEGQRIPKPVFEDILMQTFRKSANRLPLSWESTKDYHAHCVRSGWVEIDDASVFIVPRVEQKIEAA